MTPEREAEIRGDDDGVGPIAGYDQHTVWAHRRDLIRELDGVRAELALVEPLVEMGTACIDWAGDTDNCHLCQRSADGTHDPECLVGKFLAALIERACSGERRQ
jgi:hypothetical protein